MYYFIAIIILFIFCFNLFNFGLPNSTFIRYMMIIWLHILFHLSKSITTCSFYFCSSVIEWGRGTDEDRPQSCSSLSPIVHEPRKSTLKNQNIVSHSKREYDRSLVSTEINVNEKDKEIFKYFATEDANEDEESIHSQTTETASDNITTTAPIVRRRRLMFSSLKPGRRLSSRKLSISKRNEFCSKKIPKLPLLASGCLPKPHSSVSRDSNNSSNTEKKVEDTNADPKKLKATPSK